MPSEIRISITVPAGDGAFEVGAALNKLQAAADVFRQAILDLSANATMAVTVVRPKARKLTVTPTPAPIAAQNDAPPAAQPAMVLAQPQPPQREVAVPPWLREAVRQEGEAA